jgi:LemA protein
MIIGICILVVIIVLIIIGYNQLIKLKNMVKDQWSQIDVLLKRRYDLIPNLVETVKGYASHEKETLEAVINARNKATTTNSVEDTAMANNELMGTLNKLFALAEAYPELKANTNFLDLQANLKETEDKISYARQFYNDSVLKYNNKVEMIPTNIVAMLFGFKKYEFFEISEEERQVTKIKF